MRKLAPYFPLILLVLLTACAATPTKKWAQARETLTTTQNVIGSQAQAGRINDETLVTVDVIVQVARRALEVSESQLPAGGKSFDSYMAIIEASVVKLAEILEENQQ